MPTISTFFGIYIRMYLREHPPPYFHAVYGEYRAFISIAEGDVIEVGCPPWRGGSSVNGLWRTGTNSRIIGNAPTPACCSNVFQGWTMIDVLDLDRLGDFRLRVRFSDGSVGEHDFSVMVTELGPLLDPQRDPLYFDRVFLEPGAPTWPNGFDLAPEWLRREMAAAGEIVRADAA